MTRVTSFGGSPVVYFVLELSSFHVPANGLCAANVLANANSATAEISLCNVCSLGGDYIPLRQTGAIAEGLLYT